LIPNIAKGCSHVGVEHPMYFQCTCCEDTADECNCNYCPMVFCEKCQEMIMISTDEIREAWYQNNPNKNMSLEKLKNQGIVSSYHKIQKDVA